MAAVDQARLKNLKIKTGVVKRLAKEKVAYQKEYEVQKGRVEKMKAEGLKDEYDIRKQEEVLQECNMMIPDTEKRLGKAWDELKQILDSEKDLGETEEYATATTLVTETQAEAKR
eukprot:GHVU01114672.1.p1 GENE.GHVU01114672.1~~GHVU01114672.1.p1  ORF type:complete len:115 (-),score=27.88 GHVU01114672.1:615-959(-)